MRNTLFLLALLLAIAPIHAQKKTIIASASMMADMAENIVGDLAEVKYIVPRGQDPHLYKPTPSDVIMVEKADLILVNGLTFEGWIGKLIINSGTQALVDTITEGIVAIQSSKYANSFDPHAWMDVSLAKTYIDNILESIISIDPENQSVYKANHARYSNELTKLDSYITQEIKKIPENQRVLITSHDAFAYFGKRYGLQLEAIVGISTEAEAQSSDIIRVHKVIKENNVPAIFMESTINPKILEQIAKDNKIVIGGELFADSLGEKGTEADTYLKMLKHNADTIVKGLSLQTSEDSKSKGETSSSSLWTYLIIALVLLLVIAVVVIILNRNQK